MNMVFTNFLYLLQNEGVDVFSFYESVKFRIPAPVGNA